MRALEAVVVRGKDEVHVQESFRLGLEAVEQGELEDVSASSKLYFENWTSSSWWISPYLIPCAHSRSKTFSTP